MICFASFISAFFPSSVSGAAVPTCHQKDGLFVRMQFHLPGNPGTIEVGVPPAFLLVLWVFVLVARPDERDAEVSLLPVQCHLVLPGWDGRGRILLSCLIGWRRNKNMSFFFYRQVRIRVDMQPGGSVN